MEKNQNYLLSKLSYKTNYKGQTDVCIHMWIIPKKKDK